MSAGHWFRLYDEVLDDPKVQRLSEHLFKTWISALCATSRNGGLLPSVTDLAFMLRRNENELRDELVTLMEAGLLEQRNGRVTPHNWNGRQFKSDVADPSAAARMRRYRNAHRNEERNESVTAPVTPPYPLRPPDTETDTETEQNQSRQKENNPKSLKERARNGDRNAHRNGHRNGGEGYLWIVNDDARWPMYAKAYADEHGGKQPPRIAGLGGMGWHFAPLEGKP